MKRWFTVLMGILSAMAVFGLALTLTMEESMVFRETVGRGMMGVAVVGLVVCAALRPRIAQADALTLEAVRSSHGQEPVCTFQHVAANEEARKSLMLLRDYLMMPEKYARYGARMPRGVLLYGPPGTGKTLLARALAGEAGVPFFALSGSDFVEKYVGVGAMRVRDLFKNARKAGKCVIFIDEIDAMGKRRSDNSSDERDQTLNALLSEMSGFHTGDGVVVLAATNRMEMLDPALLRPGRFDRQIEVGLPGRRERRSILELHSRNKPMGDDVDLEQLAEQTAYFSGASLENLLNEAAICAAEHNEDRITMTALQTALTRMVVGEDRTSTATRQERGVIALHEAGHALVNRVLIPESRLARVSILPTGKGAAGYNLTVPPERIMLTKRDLENQMCMLLAGRAAELLAGGDQALTAGASDDLGRAAELAAAMVTELGMGGEPAVSLKALNRACGTAGEGQAACREMLAEQLERAGRILTANGDALYNLTRTLLEKEVLNGEQVAAALGTLSKESQDSTKTDEN